MKLLQDLSITQPTNLMNNVTIT